MKKLNLFVLLLLCSFFTYAQASLSGKIIDSKSKQPISYVNILCKENNKLITGGITNEKGLFSIKKLPLKTITVEIQFIGYETVLKKIDFTKEHNNLDLGMIFLKESSTTLEEVEVQTETTTITQKIDRRVVNVGKDLASAGTNALDMMQNIPSITVDLQSGTVSLRGNKNVRILIDGKPSNLSTSQLLKQIPSSSIKSVELITNPSAKYTPEGMSGIINIILKKNTQLGFNGSITVGATHGENTRPTGAINLNYRTGKFNFFGNYNLDFGKLESFTDLRRTDKDLYQRFLFGYDNTTHLGKIGVDIYLNDKNTLSFYTTQSFSNEELITDGRIFENNTLILHTPNVSKYDYNEATYNVDYKLDLDDKGQQIELDATYTKTKNPQSDFNSELLNLTSKLYNYTNNITNNIDLWLVNLDYTKPLSESTKIEVGLEARIQNTFNEIITDQEIEAAGTSILQPRGNTNFNYDRTIYSAYINYNKDFSKFSLQAGLRFEQFDVEGIFTNTQQTNIPPYIDDIFTVYPSAFLTYYASDNDEFQIGYSRRVDRPGIEQVSPIQEWTSPLTISTGNQNLTPQFTNSFELNYTRTINTGYIYLGTFYRRISDQIGRIASTDALNLDRQLLTYGNYGSSNSLGAEIYASLKPLKWWTLSPSITVTSQDNNGIINTQNVTVKNNVFNSTVQNSFKISKRLSANFTSIYRGKSKSIQFTIDAFYMFNAGAKLAVFDGKGSISLRGSDILNTLNVTFSSTQPLPQIGSVDQEFRSIYLGFSYNFGNNKYKARKRKERESNETQSSGGVL